MFNIRREGKPVKYGFNFYPLSDKYNAGFKLRYSPRRVFAIRYSKSSKKLFVYHIVADSQKSINAFMNEMRK